MKTPARIAASARTSSTTTAPDRAARAEGPGRRATTASSASPTSEEIQRLLAEHGDGWQSTVVMTVHGKDDPPECAGVRPRPAQEAARQATGSATFGDPLKFLIVTAKLLTGFDARSRACMYLDKPLRAHTLFQAITRTNRRWTNPVTGQEKTAGLVVDYIGLGAEIAKAVQMKRRRARRADGLRGARRRCEKSSPTRSRSLLGALRRDRPTRSADFATLMAAQQRLADEAIAGRVRARVPDGLQALYEFLDPETGLTRRSAGRLPLAREGLPVGPAGGHAGRAALAAARRRRRTH